MDIISLILTLFPEFQDLPLIGRIIGMLILLYVIVVYKNRQFIKEFIIQKPNRVFQILITMPILFSLLSISVYLFIL